MKAEWLPNMTVGTDFLKYGLQVTPSLGLELCWVKLDFCLQRCIFVGNLGDRWEMKWLEKPSAAQGIPLLSSPKLGISYQ